MAADNGWSGVIVNGCIRDSAEIAKIDLGVAALATNPRKSHKNGDGDTTISVSFAGVTIRPGQYIYADEDGWLVAEQALHSQE
ncbi:MAG: putative 4-hydroxy-4-methyl-2-oxoglutarate aldolase, partial [Gammaproteobacteria bacterium]|jgi:regulator of ribonuclease activity A